MSYLLLDRFLYMKVTEHAQVLAFILTSTYLGRENVSLPY